MERLKKDLSKAQAEADDWKSEALLRENVKNERDYFQQELSETREALRAAREEAAQYRQEAETWKPQEAEGSREAAVLAYLEAGHSYRDAAERFGLSKSQVGRIAQGEAV